MAMVDLAVYSDVELSQLMLDVSAELARRNAMKTAESRISAALKDAVGNGVDAVELDAMFSRAKKAHPGPVVPPVVGPPPTKPGSPGKAR